MLREGAQLMSQWRDYYSILGVDRHATAGQIRRAFHLGALRYHPDRYRGDKAYAERKFKELTEAYKFLSDENRRLGYDSRLRRREAHSRGLSPAELWEMGYGRGSGASGAAGFVR